MAIGRPIGIQYPLRTLMISGLGFQEDDGYEPGCDRSGSSSFSPRYVRTVTVLRFRGLMGRGTTYCRLDHRYSAIRGYSRNGQVGGFYTWSQTTGDPA